MFAGAAVAVEDLAAVLDRGNPGQREFGGGLPAEPAYDLFHESILHRHTPRGGTPAGMPPLGLVMNAGPLRVTGGSDQTGYCEPRFGGGAVSASPGPFELSLCTGQLVGQVHAAALLGVDQHLPTVGTCEIFLK